MTPSAGLDRRGRRRTGTDHDRQGRADSASQEFASPLQPAAVRSARKPGTCDGERRDEPVAAQRRRGASGERHQGQRSERDLARDVRRPVPSTAAASVASAAPPVPTTTPTTTAMPVWLARPGPAVVADGRGRGEGREAATMRRRLFPSFGPLSMVRITPDAGRDRAVGDDRRGEGRVGRGQDRGDRCGEGTGMPGNRIETRRPSRGATVPGRPTLSSRGQDVRVIAGPGHVRA